VFDCGAFDGDSIRQYLALRPAQSQARIIAFEPDATTFSRLAEYRRNLPPDLGERIRIEPWAVADSSAEVRFSALGSVNSGIEATGATTAIGIALDDLAIVPTFIKMDVEGFELPALRGSANILCKHEPVLAISMYHHASDLWAIPNFIKRLVPGYRLFLRRYAEDCWESILYAVPAHRLIDAASPSLSVLVNS
jgi:FkbM family methyltransferase